MLKLLVSEISVLIIFFPTLMFRGGHFCNIFDVYIIPAWLWKNL